MSLTEPERRRNPARLGLWVPLAVLAVLALGWSAAWLWLRGEVVTRLETARTSWSGEGRRLSWTSFGVNGFPFRLDVDLAGVEAREPSGTALAAPRLEAEAFVFSPGHWVIVAPDGIVFTRSTGGPVVVKARVLRASLSELGAHPPRLSLEGLGLNFQPAPGAKPYFLTAADGLHFHARAGPADQGAIYFELDGARARLGGLMARIARGRPLNVTADLIYSHAAAFAGDDWPAAGRAWSAAGGTAQVRMLRIAAGEAVLDAHSGRLAAGQDGRLEGSLTASLRQAPQALGVMGAAGTIAPEAAATAASVVAAEAGAPAAAVTVTFQAGQTTLGPAAIGPAPKVW